MASTNLTAEAIYALPVNQYGWRVLPSGNKVTLGNGVKLGDGVKWNWSPLQIQGSRHLLYVADHDLIGVGCIRESAQWWREHYEGVGGKEQYTSEQIEEYKRWLDIAAEWQAKLPKLEVVNAGN